MWFIRLEDEHSQKLQHSGEIDWWKGFDTNPDYFENYCTKGKRYFSFANFKFVDHFFPTDQKLQPLQVQLIKYTDGLATNEENPSEFENSALSPGKRDKPSESRLSCIYCNTKTYLCKESLYKHVKKCHPNQKVKCQYNKKCTRLFRTKEDLEIHVKAFHENVNGRKKRKCIYCNKLYHMGNLHHHTMIHHKTVAIKCDFKKTWSKLFQKSN
jgi:hypothetical protein